MPALAPALVLDLWERAAHLHPAQRALVLAAAADPPATAEQVAVLPIGHRDARLLRLRAGIADTPLDAVAGCPACGELVELAADSRALLAHAGMATAPAPVHYDDFAVTVRPPDSHDLAAAAACGDATAADDVLLARCITSARGPAGEVRPHELPPAVRAAAVAEMARADPLSEVLVDVECPACGAPFVADLDVSGLVWAEVDARAARLLREVDALARAYGWTEREVLDLGERRRAAYLELLAEGP